MLAFGRRLAGVSVVVACGTMASYCEADKAQAVSVERPGVLAAIGNTPLIELTSLSEQTGCRILAKCEHLNPGGSVKDRAALWMVEAAEQSGLLQPGGAIVEATGGNTGVALAMVAAAKGYKAILTLPETIVVEKLNAMRTFGAEIKLCPCVPFTDKRHFFHAAKAIADSRSNAVFTNQFDNLANMRAHLEGTAPEIWTATGGKLDAFVCSSGTGGTLAGCSAFFKSVDPSIKVFLVDPPGSALGGYVRHKALGGDDKGYIKPRVAHGVVMWSIPRSAGSPITEGIGVGRVTQNFSTVRSDGAFTGTNEEIAAMAFYLKRREGVFVGPSAALNVVGAVKLAKQLGPGHTIVTILCDGGARYQSKIYSESWLAKQNLKVPSVEQQDRLVKLLLE